MNDPTHEKALILARAKAQLLNVSPRVRGEEKQRQALDWIYRWGWSSATIIDGLSGIKGRGLSARLVKNEILKKTRTESGGGVQGVPNYILTLTKLGLQIVEKDCEILLPYNTDSYSVRQDRLRHYTIAQEITKTVLLSGNVIAFKTEKEISYYSEKYKKQPDIVWIENDKANIAIEVELSKKWDRDFDHFLYSCLLSLKEKKYDQIAIVSDSKSIIDSYKIRFEPGSKYNLYEKDKNGRWEITETHEVPNWIKGKMIWKLMEKK